MCDGCVDTNLAEYGWEVRREYTIVVDGIRGSRHSLSFDGQVHQPMMQLKDDWYEDEFGEVEWSSPHVAKFSSSFCNACWLTHGLISCYCGKKGEECDSDQAVTTT
jgi:hypothetical protein